MQAHVVTIKLNNINLNNMKQLTIEEKARAYDRALKVAKDIRNGEATYISTGTPVIDAIFPELQMSEDNKAMKELLAWLKNKQVNPSIGFSPIKMEQWIAWLEKVIIPSHNDIDSSFIEDIKNVIAEAPLLMQSDKKKMIDWLEKQGHTDGIIEKAKTEKQRVIITETEGNANIDWDTRSLEDARKLLECGLQYINTEVEKQGEQKEINLIEILKHYPKETELYSPLYGKLWLAEVNEKNEIITCYKHHLEEGCTRAVLEQEDTVSFYSNGTTGLPDFNMSKNCMLFLYDIEKQGSQREQLINKACDVLVNCIEDYMLRRMEVWNEECKKQTLENIRKKLEE